MQAKIVVKTQSADGLANRISNLEVIIENLDSKVDVLHEQQKRMASQEYQDLCEFILKGEEERLLKLSMSIDKYETTKLLKIEGQYDEVKFLMGSRRRLEDDIQQILSTLAYRRAELQNLKVDQDKLLKT